MLLASFYIIVGFILLIASGDRFVNSAAQLARHYKLSPVLIGVTIAAFGSSAPEILISIIAATQNNPHIAAGNAVGSNITNIGLVLGICALAKPFAITKRFIKQEIPLLLIVMCIVAFLLWPLNLFRLQGVILLLLFFLVVYFLLILAKRHPTSEITPITQTVPQMIFWISLGCILMPIGSNLLIDGAEMVGKHFEIPQVVMGLTLIAVGTSLPELVISLLATLKNHGDMAVANVIGSNLFNLTAVLAPAGLIAPDVLPANFFTRDMLSMLGFTCLLLWIYAPHKKIFGRLEGFVLLTCYCAYLGMLSYSVLV